MIRNGLTRRDVLLSSLAVPSVMGPAHGVEAAKLPLTPACEDGPKPTRAQTEGPYFTAKSPLKRNFAADGKSGKPFVLVGFVLSPACRPIAGARADLWHTDATGAYDNSGFNYRGHQITDDLGRYVFETIVPGSYPGRTRHFHLKIAPPGGAVLTTQLYFPGEEQNKRDGLFQPSLLMKVSDGGGAQGLIGRFDFVVRG